MLKVLTWLLRLVFLILLYSFIFKIVQFMIKDLGRTSSQGRVKDLAWTGLTQGAAKLTVLETVDSSLAKGVDLPLGDRVSLGRGNQNQIRIEDNFASLEHAKIYFRDGQFWIEDLQSLNGTFVNGHQIEKPIVLTPYDQIKIGGTTFQFMRWDYEVQ